MSELTDNGLFQLTYVKGFSIVTNGCDRMRAMNRDVVFVNCLLDFCRVVTKGLTKRRTQRKGVPLDDDVIE